VIKDVFDEMVNWYSPMKIAEDGEARNGDVSSNVEQKSQLIVEHNSLQLMDLIAFHGKEYEDLQTLYMIVFKHHLKILM
jgi:hypothetical protein